MMFLKINNMKYIYDRSTLKFILSPLNKNSNEWILECAVCGARYENWAGSTPCCGSLGFIVDTKIEEREKKIKKLLDNIKK